MIRSLLASVLRPILRRDEGQIARIASGFRIRREGGRRLVDHLGRAFLGGFNAMIDLPGRDAVTRRGMQVPPHFRPFFFEGAAMGYLPRAWWDRDHSPASVERHLMEMSPDFLFLYYVGLGFWYGLRHPRHPERLLSLAPHVSSLYFPLCFDGFGFKTAFFDFERSPGVIDRMEQVPEPFRPYAYQGFGRAMFFVFMDDPDGFDRIASSVPETSRLHLESGRALATGFTGADRPAELMEFLAGSRGDDELAARLGGLAWAMTARERNDRAYFEECVAKVSGKDEQFLLRLPDLCNAALERVDEYGEWQRSTREAAIAAYRSAYGQTTSST